MYGITKLAGEYAALAYNPETLVIRTAGLYGLGGNRSKGGNFVERILGAARERGSLQVVADQQLTPTFCGDLAAATLEAVERGARGIVHLTNARIVLVVRLHARDPAARRASRSPSSRLATVPRPGVADRPANGILDRPRADALGPDAAAAVAGRPGRLHGAGRAPRRLSWDTCSASSSPAAAASSGRTSSAGSCGSIPRSSSSTSTC